MQETSLDAYYSTVLPSLGRRKNQVFRVFLENHPRSRTNMEAADLLDWSINRVTGRVYDLRKDELLEYDTTRICSITGNRAIAWRVREDIDVKELLLKKLLGNLEGWRNYLNSFIVSNGKIQLKKYIPWIIWSEINKRLKKKGYTYTSRLWSWIKK